ncbi:MAG TPA: type II toxin-antitoxin system HicB family antitoxin [Candidatus Elarobacter sp.]|nr:type II toxin-antitoxin system HicB family antitoxin [Candidatus Elarobacter sp.]
MRFYVVYEQTETGWAAYPPDLPGVGVAGSSRQEAQDLIRGAIEMHLEGLRQDGLPIPQPTGEFVEVA